MNTPESETTPTPPAYAWTATNAPQASSRTDDLWFLDADRGWIVNSNGHILHTSDGGQTWQLQHVARGAYLRCVAFADARRGWVGTLSADQRLLGTADGGATWQPVDTLPAGLPPAVCGMSVLDENVLLVAGSNFPDQAPGIAKSVDGGRSWTAIPMSEHATLLVDVYFRDELHGLVVGGTAVVPDRGRDNVRPVVLATEDGGETWENRLAGIDDEFPFGEWGWKIQMVDEQIGFVSLENYSDGAILKTTDGGRTWTRKPINDPQDNANLEGIGFVDGMHGWVGGWGDRNFSGGFTSETRDGGETWTDANEVGRFLNRFRFIREPELVAYAAGDTVYKYSPISASERRDPIAGLESAAPREPAPPAVLQATLPLRIPVDTPEHARSVRVDVWDRFGRHLATPLIDDAAASGVREVVWAGETDSGEAVAPGMYLYRVTIDDEAESQAVLIR